MFNYFYSFLFDFTIANGGMSATVYAVFPLLDCTRCISYTDGFSSPNIQLLAVVRVGLFFSLPISA